MKSLLGDIIILLAVILIALAACFFITHKIGTSIEEEEACFSDKKISVVEQDSRNQISPNTSIEEGVPLPAEQAPDIEEEQQEEPEYIPWHAVVSTKEKAFRQRAI